MKRQMGFILWFILPISCLATLVASPFLDSWAHWALIISGQVFLLWAAVKSTFGKDIQHGIGVVLALSGMGIAGIIRRIGRWRNRKKKLREIEKNKPKPTRVAKRNIEIASVHPRLANRNLTVILGYDARKRPVSIDLAGCHTIVSGTSGGGKTNLLNAMLIQLYNRHRQNFETYIIDRKGDREDGLYKWGPVATKIVEDIGDSLELLKTLNNLAERRYKESKRKKRTILLIIDEVAQLTQATLDKEHRAEAMSLLSMLAEKARSAKIYLVMATQYPKYTVLDTRISMNFSRRICLPVQTAKQAEVVLGFNPKGGVPKLAGQFILSDGLHTKRGRALLVHQEEIDTVVLKNISTFREKELQLWKIVGLGKEAEDTITGIRKTFAAHPELGQDFVKFGFRHLAYAGVLTPPKQRGESSRMAVSFLDGIHLIKEYMKEGRWTGEPEPFVRMK